MFHVALIYMYHEGKMHWHHAFHMHGHIASIRVWVHGIEYSPVLVNGSGAQKMGQSPKLRLTDM